jgi:ATP-dependent Clp protease ATP-binding subunit ClpA
MAVFVVRAFVRMRRTMAAHKEMGEKLSDLERRVMGHDETIRSLVQAIRQLMAPPQKPRRSIGFKVEEARPRYRRRRRQRSNVA